MDHSGDVPSIFSVMNALVYSGLGRYSRETSLVFGDAVQHWRKEIKANADLGSDADVYAIELKLNDVSDVELRSQILEIPTAFRVEERDLKALRVAARQMLSASAEYARFRNSVVSSNK